MSVHRILCDQPITPPNMLLHVANYGHHRIHAWMCDVYLRTTGRQCMCVGWLFGSNQNEVTVITDCQFNSTRASSATLSSSTVSRTQKHKHNIWGELDCTNHHKERKQSRNKCHSTKSERSPQNTTARNTETLKILHINCILLATSVR